MTARDDARKQCIKAMSGAMVRDMFADHELPVDDELWDKYIQTATAVLNALGGAFFVCSHAVTEEMENLGDDTYHMEDGDLASVFLAMSAAGDLTNAQETKP